MRPSVVSQLHHRGNKSAGVDVINTQGMCCAPSGVYCPLPSLLSFPASNHLSITHGPLGIPSSVEILKLGKNVLSVSTEEIST